MMVGTGEEQLGCKENAGFWHSVLRSFMGCSGVVVVILMKVKRA